MLLPPSIMTKMEVKPTKVMASVARVNR